MIFQSINGVFMIEIKMDADCNDSVRLQGWVETKEMLKQIR
jgi:hypothetical protein